MAIAVGTFDRTRGDRTRGDRTGGDRTGGDPVPGDPIQDELAARAALLGMRAAGASAAALAAEVDAIRAAALAHGLFPAVAVTHAIEAALARGERGALVLGWLHILRDALSCDRRDVSACETYAAACSVRLTG